MHRCTFEWPWVTLSDSKILNQTERRAASPRQLSLLSDVDIRDSNSGDTEESFRSTAILVWVQCEMHFMSKVCTTGSGHFPPCMSEARGISDPGEMSYSLHNNDVTWWSYPRQDSMTSIKCLLHLVITPPLQIYYKFIFQSIKTAKGRPQNMRLHRQAVNRKVVYTLSIADVSRW